MLYNNKKILFIFILTAITLLFSIKIHIPNLSNEKLLLSSFLNSSTNHSQHSLRAAASAYANQNHASGFIDSLRRRIHKITNRKQKVANNMRAMVKSERFLEIVTYMLNLAKRNKNFELEYAALALVDLAGDSSKTPCCINHDVTHAIEVMCRQNPAFFKLFAYAISDFLQQDIAPYKKSGVSEIINKLNWLSCRIKPEKHFAKILAEEIGEKRCLDELRECYFNHYNLLVPLALEGDPFFSDKIEIPGTDDLALRGYAYDWYYIERNGQLEGVVYFSSPSERGVSYFSIQVFESTNIGIGSAVLKWMVKTLQDGNFAEPLLIYQNPADRRDVEFLLKCKQKGLLKDVFAAGLFGNNARLLSNHASAWVSVSSFTGAKTIKLHHDCNIFLKATIRPSQEIIQAGIQQSA